MKKSLPEATKQSFLEEIERTLFEDHDFALYTSSLLFEDTGNPLYAWRAFYACIKNKKMFPDWVLIYLFECAERMQTDTATQATDVRAILPWVFGFIRTGKSGPGSLLNPHNDPDDKKMRFGLRFAGRLKRGEEPAEARANAYNDVFSGDADTDDKTLQRWLLKEFVETAPSTAEEWTKVCDEHYGNFVRYVLSQHGKEKVSRDSAVTRHVAPSKVPVMASGGGGSAHENTKGQATRA